MGAVIIKQGTARLLIENVISVTGTEDVDYPDEGLYEINVNSAITNSEKISHDDARIKTMAFLQKIVEKGWQSTIPRGMARIRGKDMNNYKLENRKTTTLDPMYVPTLREWMRFTVLTEWEFYFNGAYLTVQMSREPTLTDPQKPGVYLISTIIQSESDYFRGYLDGQDRARWKDLLMSQITNMAEHRATLESEFRKKGIAIDETYVDPPLPSLEK
ncbi:MAG: hypothetical protein JWQ01_2958 [Massilia sp.]|nr:hypothetical protein [Massilia sp.]